MVLQVVVKFVAYIDESGDTGLEDIKGPVVTKGASEWLVLSCMLLRIENDNRTLGWVREIQSKFRNNQSPHLHFADLIPVKKKIACDLLATKPCRFFIVASNKRNIEDYVNARAASASGQVGTSWLYWFLSRLLLERVTDYCERRTPPSERGNAKLRIIFSRRGGLMYKDFDRYLWKLRWQSVFGTLFIDYGDLCWSVIDFEEVFVLDHVQRAGLQLADIGAGAFYCALERNRPGDCDAQFAKALQPRIAIDDRNAALGYGIKAMPDLRKMGLMPEQRVLFEHYGYPPEEW